VRIGFGAPEFERAIYQPLIDTFNAANPDLQVVFVPVEPAMGSGRLYSELIQEIAGQADTFSALVSPSELAQSGVATNLRPLADADATFDAADYQPGALTGAADGSLYLLPHTLSVQLLTYNRDLWRAAGLTEPAPGWRWDDLLAAAETLVRRDGDQVVTYGIDDGRDGMLVLLGLLAEAGVRLAPAADGQVLIDRPEVAAALERVADLITRGVIYQRPTNPGGTISFDQIGEHIREQEVALWIGNLLMLGGPFGSAEPEFAIGTAALPMLPAGELASQRGYAMSNRTAQPDLAWRWLAFLSRQNLSGGNGMMMVMGTGFDVPVRESLALEQGFWAAQPDEQVAVVRSALNVLERAPASAHQAVYGHMRAALSAVRAATPVASALADAQANLNEQELTAPPAASPSDRGAVQLPNIVPTPQPHVRRVRFTAIDNLPELRALAERFNTQQNEIFVEVEAPSFSTDFSARSMAERFDCLAWLNTPNAAELSAFADLQPFFDADPRFALSDYPAGLLAPLRDGTRLHGLPYAVDLRTLRYNSNAFAAAGLDTPTADWDLADLLDAVSRLHDPTSTPPRYGYGVYGIGIDDLNGFLNWQGAAIADSAGAPQLTRPELITAAQQYIDLLRNYSAQTSLEGYTEGGFLGASSGLIDAGQVGLWFNYGMSAGGIVISIGGAPTTQHDVGIAPPPAGTAGLSSTDVRASTLLISATSADPAGCWEWITFLSEQTSGLGDRFPARSSVAESAEFVRTAPPGAAEVYAAYRTALNAPAQTPAQRQFDPFWFYQAVDRALQGADLERELARAQDLSEQHYACVQGGTDFAGCADLVDPERR
jgi:ABC-type glycerol-3-phosphate transport system substrate-binding protein